MVSSPDRPIGQAPGPAPALSCARKVTKVVSPQITQENTCGRIRLRRISRREGTKTTSVNSRPHRVKNSFRVMTHPNGGNKKAAYCTTGGLRGQRLRRTLCCDQVSALLRAAWNSSLVT